MIFMVILFPKLPLNESSLSLIGFQRQQYKVVSSFRINEEGKSFDYHVLFFGSIKDGYYVLSKSALEPSSFSKDDFNRIFTFINQINYSIMNSKAFIVESITIDDSTTYVVREARSNGDALYVGNNTDKIGEVISQLK